MRVNKVENLVTLDQESYVDLLLQKFNLVDCKPTKTPLENNCWEAFESKVNNVENVKCNLPYQQLIGSLMNK